jgi:hypothetical protein
VHDLIHLYPEFSLENVEVSLAGALESGALLGVSLDDSAFPSWVSFLFAIANTCAGVIFFIHCVV